MPKTEKDMLFERRRYVRLETPITVRYVASDGKSLRTATAKNISADGIRFETDDRSLAESSSIEMRLELANANNPVHMTGTVIWKKRLSTEDNAPYDFGIEFAEIEDDNKNTFLKFLCDLMYTKGSGRGKTA